MDFKELLKEKAKECDNQIMKYFDNLSSEHTTLYEAMRYSAASGGKRLRMILLKEACRLFSDDISASIPFACAVEMIHAYSLIHDDLPSIDNSPIRRGKPSNHMVFGEDMAILAGDGLLNYAFEIMTEYAVSNKEKSHLFLRAISEIAKASGIRGMVFGQAIDVQTSGKETGLELLTLTEEKKTAEMFNGALKAGAITGGADEPAIRIMGEYARNFGLAFQITDDILDVTGDEKKLGKKAGLDSMNKKTTFVSLCGVEKAKSMADGYLEKAADIIKPIDKYGFFTEICGYIKDREA